MSKKIVLLTGVSGSGKTTIQEKLIKEYGWTRPINFTTRKPRSDKAYDVDSEGDFSNEAQNEYVYITKEQFMRKLAHGDLAEFTYYDGNFYGISNHIDYSRDNIIIVDPIGLAAMKRKFLLEGRKFSSVYLHIPEETQEYRLGVIRRDSYSSIAERRKDYKYFPYVGKYDVVLDGEENINTNIRNIINL